MKNVGEKIKIVREINNYSQSYVAKIIGMSQSNYARIESGQTKITFDTLNKIASAIGTKSEIITSFKKEIYTSINNEKINPNEIIKSHILSVKEVFIEEKLLLEKKIKIMEKLLSIY